MIDMINDQQEDIRSAYIRMIYNEYVSIQLVHIERRHHTPHDSTYPVLSSAVFSGTLLAISIETTYNVANSTILC